MTQQQQQQQSPTTKVVSLRNIPNEITDLQIVLMGLQFGDVVNILYIRGKGQVYYTYCTLGFIFPLMVVLPSFLFQ